MKLIKRLTFCLIVVSLLFFIPIGRVPTMLTEAEAQVKEKLAPNPTTPTPSPTPSSRKLPDNAKLIKYPEKGIPILMYHSISTNPQNNLCVSEEQFNAEMEWLHSQNYYTLSMDEYCEALLNGASIPEKSVLITFDDGYLDNYKAGWPILKKYDFVGTFFIITSTVDTSSGMTMDQLKELVKGGNSIGSHTVNHHDLAKLSDAQQEKELSESKKFLEDKLGVSVKSICYPSGKYNESTKRILPTLGYKVAVTTKGGDACLSDGQFALCRIRIFGGMSLAGFKTKF